MLFHPPSHALVQSLKVLGEFCARDPELTVSGLLDSLSFGVVSVYPIVIYQVRDVAWSLLENLGRLLKRQQFVTAGWFFDVFPLGRQRH